MAYDAIRSLLVRWGGTLAVAGAVISFLAVLLRLFGIVELFGIYIFSYFIGGIWLMLLGALARFELLVSMGRERLSHPEIYEEPLKRKAA